MNRNIHNLDRYDYELDQKFISSYPLEKRENSKLLVYRDKKIIDSNFKNISNHLPTNSTLFFNDSKVLKGRLFFANKNNAKIEILVTDKNIPRLLNKKSPLLVDAMIGNNKKWKKDEVLEKKIDDYNYLEKSNVNPVEELILTLEHQRNYETHVKFIDLAKQMDEGGASLMRIPE